jgi:hypothetical protein
MKLITLIALIPFFSAQAVVVKTCPEKVTVSLPKIFNNDVIDEEAFGDDSSFPFDGWNGPGIFRLQQKLAKLGSLTLELDLIRTGNSQCSYRGVDQNGDYASAVLYGSTRQGAKEPATLKFYAVGSLAGYVGISEVAQSGLTSRHQFAGLYYRGEHCSWGDCIPDHISIGSAPVTLK